SSASHATTSIAQWPVSNERCAPLSSVILSNSASFSGLIWIVIGCPFRVVTGAESRDGLERGDVLLLDQVGDQIAGSAFVVEMREGHDLHLVRELDVDPGLVCKEAEEGLRVVRQVQVVRLAGIAAVVVNDVVLPLHH